MLNSTTWQSFISKHTIQHKSKSLLLFHILHKNSFLFSRTSLQLLIFYCSLEVAVRWMKWGSIVSDDIWFSNVSPPWFDLKYLITFSYFPMEPPPWWYGCSIAFLIPHTFMYLYQRYLLSHFHLYISFSSVLFFIFYMHSNPGAGKRVSYKICAVVYYAIFYMEKVNKRKLLFSFSFLFFQRKSATTEWWIAMYRVCSLVSLILRIRLFVKIVLKKKNSSQF